MRLSENMKSLTKNIINSKNVRNSEIKKIASEAKKALDGFAGESKMRASDLRKDLKNFRQGLKKDVSSMLSGFAEADKARASDLRKDLKSSKSELKKNVSSMLSGFAEVDKARARDLQKDLKSARSGLKKDVSSMRSGFAEVDKARARDLYKDLKSVRPELKKNVSSLLGDYKSDRIEAAKAWRTMTVALDKKSDISVQPEEKKKAPEVKLVAKPVVAPEPKKAPEVKLVAKPVVAPDFEAHILKIVQQNPHGIKMTRIQNFTGIPAVRLNVIINKLFSDGKISKKGNKYFSGKK